MEKTYTALKESNNLKEMEESITVKTNGGKYFNKFDSFNDFLIFCKKSLEEKLSKGWVQTQFGLLSPLDIKESGLINVDGYWCVPGDELISDGNYGRKPGEKYIGLNKKFIDWYKSKHKISFSKEEKDIIKKVENLKESEVVKVFKTQDSFYKNNTLDVDKIPF